MVAQYIILGLSENDAMCACVTADEPHSESFQAGNTSCTITNVYYLRCDLGVIQNILANNLNNCGVKYHSSSTGSIYVDLYPKNIAQQVIIKTIGGISMKAPKGKVIPDYREIHANSENSVKKFDQPAMVIISPKKVVTYRR